MLTIHPSVSIHMLFFSDQKKLQLNPPKAAVVGKTEERWSIDMFATLNYI